MNKTCRVVAKRKSDKEEAQAMGATTHLDRSSLKAETLLHDGGQLANAASLLAEDALRAGGKDDNLRALGGHADVDTRVTAERKRCLELDTGSGSLMDE